MHRVFAAIEVRLFGESIFLKVIFAPATLWNMALLFAFIFYLLSL
jgi:hypothetical protein